ncbi:MAG: hypothetical protein U1F46_17580 [Marinagarivorans sp.]
MPLPSEQIKARENRLVAAVKAVLSGQVGLTVGSIGLRKKLSHIDRELLAKYPIFEEYCSALPLDMPVGTERLHWNLEIVLKSDPKLAKLEFKYRAKLLKSCADIIKEYS